jgi:hypothetical protein
MNFKNSFDPYKENNYNLLLNDLYFGVWNIPHRESDLHKTIGYDVNSDGYRSAEFDGTAEIMSLGCSFTYGVGLEEEMIWPNILAKKINNSLVNLAQPGDSTSGQIRKAFAYFKKYGNPKMIVANFPLYRMEFPIVNNKLSIAIYDDNTKKALQKEFEVEDRKHPRVHKIKNFLFYDDNFEKISKAPYNPENILPKEIAVFYAHYHIQILEQYCKTNNIKFFWTVWEDYMKIYDFFINEQPEIVKNYVTIDWPNFFNNGEYADRTFSCGKHKEYEDHELYNFAADRENGKLAHLGWHTHMHIADNFYAKI